MVRAGMSAKCSSFLFDRENRANCFFIAYIIAVHVLGILPDNSARHLESPTITKPCGLIWLFVNAEAYLPYRVHGREFICGTTTNVYSKGKTNDLAIYIFVWQCLEYNFMGY